MKKLVNCLLLVVLSQPALAASVMCHYQQTENNKTHKLDVQINVDEYQVEIAKLLPYGIRNYIYDDVVILCNDTSSLFVTAENLNDEAEMHIVPGGKSTLNYKKSIHGAYSVELTCEPFDIVSLCL